MLRHDRPLPGKSWGARRRSWLSARRFPLAASQLTLDAYLEAVDLDDRRIEALEREIAEMAAQGPWAPVVVRLRCLRGVDTLNSATYSCFITSSHGSPGSKRPWSPYGGHV